MRLGGGGEGVFSIYSPPVLTDTVIYSQKRRGVGAVRVKDRVSKIQEGEFDDEEFGIMPREVRTSEREENQ